MINKLNIIIIKVISRNGKIGQQIRSITMQLIVKIDKKINKKIRIMIKINKNKKIKIV